MSLSIDQISVKPNVIIMTSSIIAPFSPQKPHKTLLRIENHTTVDIVKTVIEDEASIGFIGKDRPSMNFHGIKIKAGDYEERKEEVWKHYKDGGFFEMTLYFKDGLKDTFSARQYCNQDSGLDFELFEHDHVVEHCRKLDTLVVTVRHTKDQLRNFEAVRLLNEAVRLIRQKSFEYAINVLVKANKKASERQTIKDIEKRRLDAENGWAREIQKRGLKLLRKQSFDAAIEAFVDALRHAKDTYMRQQIEKYLQETKNRKIEFLNKQAEEYMDQKNFEMAIARFEEALKFTN